MRSKSSENTFDVGLPQGEDLPAQLKSCRRSEDWPVLWSAGRRIPSNGATIALWTRSPRKPSRVRARLRRHRASTGGTGPHEFESDAGYSSAGNTSGLNCQGQFPKKGERHGTSAGIDGCHAKSRNAAEAGPGSVLDARFERLFPVPEIGNHRVQRDAQDLETKKERHKVDARH